MWFIPIGGVLNSVSNVIILASMRSLRNACLVPFVTANARKEVTQ